MIDPEYVVGDVRSPIGDVRSPIGDGRKLIIHCCNDIGLFGAGVALAIANKWKNVRDDYMAWSKSKETFSLGNIKAVMAEKDIAVVNMIAQHKVGHDKDGNPPIRYDAMGSCLSKVASLATKNKASVHVPFLMGCALAGGNWEIVEKLIVENLCSKDIKVIIYDFENKRNVSV